MSDLKIFDIICDICGSIIKENAGYHGDSYYGHTMGHSICVSKYNRDNRIDVCNNHSDRIIESFISEIQRSIDTTKSPEVEKAKERPGKVI